MSFPPAFHTPRLSFTPINADMHAAAVFETRGREDVMKYRSVPISLPKQQNKTTPT